MNFIYAIGIAEVGIVVMLFALYFVMAFILGTKEIIRLLLDKWTK